MHAAADPITVVALLFAVGHDFLQQQQRSSSFECKCLLQTADVCLIRRQLRLLLLLKSSLKLHLLLYLSLCFKLAEALEGSSSSSL
jgi:hypothetical protein